MRIVYALTLATFLPFVSTSSTLGSAPPPAEAIDCLDCAGVGQFEQACWGCAGEGQHGCPGCTRYRPQREPRVLLTDGAWEPPAVAIAGPILTLEALSKLLNPPKKNSKKGGGARASAAVASSRRLVASKTARVPTG